MIAADSLEMIDSLALIESTATAPAVPAADSLQMVVEEPAHVRLLTKSQQEGYGSTSHEIFTLAILVLYLIWCNRRLAYRQRHTVDNTYSAAKPKRGDVLPTYTSNSVVTYLLVVVAISLVTSQLMGDDSWRVLWGITIGWHAVGAVQFMILRMVSFLAYNEGLCADVFRLKREFFIFVMAWSLPVSLIMCIVGDFEWSLYIAVTQLIVVLSGYIFTLYQLFRSKKISISNGILYLCAVEVIPVVLMWTILTRNLVQINTL